MEGEFTEKASGSSHRGLAGLVLREVDSLHSLKIWQRLTACGPKDRVNSDGSEFSLIQRIKKLEDAIAISDSDSDDSVSLSTNLDFLAQHWMDAKPHTVCRNPLAVEIRKSAMPRTSISRVGLLSYPYLSSTELDQFSSAGQHSSKWRDHMIKNPAANLHMNKHNSKSETAKTLLKRFSELDREAGISKQDSEEDLDRRSSV